MNPRHASSSGRGRRALGLCAMLLILLAAGGATWGFHPFGRDAQALTGVIAALLALALLGYGLMFLFVRRNRRRLRREIGIPWATNGHGTRTMYSELQFQQTMLQLHSKLGLLEDKAHRLESHLMRRAVQGDWNP